MSDLAERLDNIRVRATVPGTELYAELRNRNEVALTFGEGVYEFIDERALERTLASLAKRLYTGWLREYREVISTTGINIEPQDQHDYNFLEELHGLEVSVTSSDERITLSTVGMLDFSAKLCRGTVRELTEKEFTARVAEIAPQLIFRYQAQASQLKARYYG